MNGAQFARARALVERKPMTARRRRRALAHLVREARAAVVIVGGKEVGFRTPDGFVVCVKRRHATMEAAQAELDDIHRFPTSRGAHVPVRAYHCPACKGWHLTSAK